MDWNIDAAYPEPIFTRPDGTTTWYVEAASIFTDGIERVCQYTVNAATPELALCKALAWTRHGGHITRICGVPQPHTGGAMDGDIVQYDWWYTDEQRTEMEAEGERRHFEAAMP